MNVTRLAELRVLLEEQVERAEAAQDVLREVRAVDAQDEVLAPAAQQLLLVLAHAVALRPCCWIAFWSIGSG